MSNVFVFRQLPPGVINEYFGGGGKGGTTTSSQTVSIPPEVLARYNAVNARAEDTAQQPFQQYGGEFVAPLTPTQIAGTQATNAAAGQAQPYYNAATQGLQAAQQGGTNYIGAAGGQLGAAQQAGQQYGSAAGQQYGQAGGVAAPYYQAATQGTQQAVAGAQPYQQAATMAALAGAQGIDPGRLQTGRYMNPYVGSVVGATQAAMGQQQGQQLAQQQAEAIRAGAFGGERAGLQRQTLRGQQELAQAQAIAPLYQQGYQQALQTAQQQQGVGLGAAQANRAAIQQAGQQLAGLGQQGYSQQLGAAQQLQGLGQGLYGQALGTGQAVQGLGQQQYAQGAQTAQQLAALGQQGYTMGAGTAQQLAGLGTGAQQASLQGAQAQMAAGQVQQQTQQAQDTAQYQQFLQERGYPFQVAQFLANIAMGTGALSGSTTSGTQTAPGGFFSDKRLKDDVKEIGETHDGQPIYSYKYKGDDRTQIGLMAQDVEKKHPDAVGLMGGYKTVDYKKATEDAERTHKDMGGGLTPQMLTPEMEAGDTTPSVEMSGMTPENADAAYNSSSPNPTSGWGPRQDTSVALRGSWKDLPASRLTNTPDDRNSSGSAAMWSAPGARYGRATGGGLVPDGFDPNSMGGAVSPDMAGEGFERGGYVGGGLVDANDWASIVAANKQALGVYGGAQPMGGPVGATGIVPAATIPVPKPIEAAKMSMPAQRPSGMSTAMQTGKDIAGTYKGGKEFLLGSAADKSAGLIGGGGELKGKSWGGELKDWWNTPSPAATGGLIVPRHAYAGGGSEDEETTPYDVKETMSGQDPMKDVLKSGAHHAQLMTAKGMGGPGAQGGQGGQSGLGQLASGLGTAKSLYGMGSGALSGLGELGAGFSSAGNAAGLDAALGPGFFAENIGLGAGGASAAGTGLMGSIGSGLGTAAAGAGASIMEALPFLAMFSDARVKDNIRPVGKTFDGQNIYSYNIGEGPTQMGLMAQEVLDRKPEAVGQRAGLLTVDYDRATEDASPYASGGLVPRQGYALRGATDVPADYSPEADMPSPNAQEAGLVVEKPRDTGSLFAGIEDKYGLPSGYLNRAWQIESGAGQNMKSPSSSARGHFQFIEGTQKQMGLKDPYDLAESADAAGRYAAQNRQFLKLHGVEEPSAGHLYLAHQQGPLGAVRLLNAKDRPAGLAVGNDAAISGNRGDPNAPGSVFANKIMNNFAGIKEPASGPIPEGAPRPPGVMGGTDVRAPSTGAEGKKSIGDVVTSEGFIVPALGFLGSMLASNRPNLGQALGEGIMGGVGAYQAQQKQASDIAKKTAETKLTEAEVPRTEMQTQAIKAGIFERRFVPNRGWQVINKATNEIFYVTDANLNPISGTGFEKSYQKIPVTGDGVNPESPTAVKTNQGVMETDITKLVKPPKSAADWKPVTSVPEQYEPKEHSRIVASDDSLKSGLVEGTKTKSAQAAKAEGSGKQRIELEQMIANLDKLPQTGFFGTSGPGAEARLQMGLSLNSAAAMIGGKPLTDPNVQAAQEAMKKGSFRLGAALSNSIGSREPGFIVAQAVGANPTIESSERGFRLLAAGLLQSAAYEEDKARFYDDYLSRFQHLSGAEDAFKKLNPPEYYAQKAVISAVDPVVLEELKRYGPQEKLRKQIDSTYGNGITDILMGKKRNG